jgi:hypothetical protein
MLILSKIVTLPILVSGIITLHLCYFKLHLLLLLNYFCYFPYCRVERTKNVSERVCPLNALPPLVAEKVHDPQNHAEILAGS